MAEIEPHDPAASDKSVGPPTWLLWGVPMALALVLRWVSLDLNSMSHDELSTWARTEYPRLRGVIQYGVVPDYHPPGHFMLIWVIKQLGFESAVALRLPSVLAGVLSVGVLYRIGAQLYDRWTGSLSAMLMAVSWPLIFYSQDARAYAFLVLFTLLSIDASARVVRALHEERSPCRWHWAQLVLSGAAAAYVHYYGLFFVGLLGMGSIIVLLPHASAVLRAALGFIAISLLYVPWLPTLLDDLNHAKTWVVRHDVDFFPRWWTWIHGGAEAPAIAAAAIVVLGAWAALLRSSDKPRFRWTATILVVAWLVMPGLIAFLKSLWSTPALTNRNILPSVPAAILLVAQAIRYFPGKTLVRSVLFVGMFGSLLWNLISVKAYYEEPTKEEYRDVVKTIVDADTGFLFARCGIRAHFAYYLEQFGATPEIDKNLCRKHQLGEFEDRNAGKPITFVRVHYKPDQEVLDYLDDHYLTTQLFKRRDAVAMRLEPRPVEPEPVATEPDVVPISDESSPDEALQEDSLGQVETNAAEPGCSTDMPRLDRVGSWSMWPFRPGQLMDTLENGVRFRRNTEDDGRAHLCMKNRVPVDGAVTFSGEWSVQFGDGGGGAQLSARYYGADGKWVKGEDEERPVWLVKTTKKKLQNQAYEKTLQAPKAAKDVQLCLILSGTEGSIELLDTCVESTH